MNSNNCSSDPAWPKEIPKLLALEVRGIGPTPNLKNAKKIGINRKTGKRFPRTEKRVKQWMEKAIADLESQLFSICQEPDGTIQTECLQRFWTAYGMLSDDSTRQYPEGHWKVLQVPHGLEGFSLVIEKLSDLPPF